MGQQPKPVPDERPALGHRVRAAVTRTAPGLGLVAVGVLVAFLLGRIIPVVGPLLWAVLLGAVVNNLGRGLTSMRPGVQVATRQLLRTGVVLLGLQLAFGDLLARGVGVGVLIVVTALATFLGTCWLGRLLRLRTGTTLLAAAGFSICGASAVAAMGSVCESDEEDVATSVALVTLFGTVAIVTMPVLAGLLDLSAQDYGLWVGASVQEVAQVVAAGSAVSGALTVALAVKLTRVVLLAPMVAVVSVVYRRRATRNRSADEDPGAAAGQRPRLVPPFVVGFVLACVLGSVGVLPDAALTVTDWVSTVLLTAGLFGLGAGVRVAALRATGPRPFVLGLGASIIAAVVPYGGLHLL